MLKQRHFIINYIINNQPESIDIQTDAEAISDEEAKIYISESRDIEAPANITEISIIGVQHPIDTDFNQYEKIDADYENKFRSGNETPSEDGINSEERHDQE